MTKLKCHVCGEEWGTCKHTKFFDGTMEDAEKIMRRLATKCYEFTKQIQSQAKLITQLGEALKFIHTDCRIHHEALSAYMKWKEDK